MSTEEQQADEPVSKDVPRDAVCIDAILRSMGVVEYEPRIIHQLLEFMHRHVCEVVNDAQMYQQHAGRSKMDISDIRLAIQTKMNFAFVQPPQREVLHAIALEGNSQALPVIDPERVGLRIPPEQYCLTATNYIVQPKK
uniref:Transcription initiation factor TFIID subunit 12 domain-containing protein n=1 Tax=Spongospora subterranea TaxID=70186 RepID=A0A0H5R9W1_9EUKA|eukprot:CRZ10576.1 hypothetical protein [Spongospora subterranea]